MKKLLSSIQGIDPKIKEVIDRKIEEFSAFDYAGNDLLFDELCFCLLTANFTAERALEIQQKIGMGFQNLSQEELAAKLKELGYRFPNVRSKYIVEARQHKNMLRKIVDAKDRGWLVQSVKGLGMKEASHFLRNVGVYDFAIVDFHIADILADNNLIVKPKTMTPKAYVEIEKVLGELCVKLNLKQGELDLYLWYLETGKIFK